MFINLFKICVGVPTFIFNTGLFLRLVSLYITLIDLVFWSISRLEIVGNKFSTHYL